MKSWILRFRSADAWQVEEIRKGRKTVETRAATERYRKIKKGDTLVIVCGKERLERRVKRVKIFKSLKALPRRSIMPWTKSFAEMQKAYYSYPGYREKIKKCGIIAFYL